MGFLKRETMVVSAVGRVIGQGLLGLGRLALGGPTRRRATLVLLVIGTGMSYVLLTWELRRLLREVLLLVFGIPAPGQPLAPGTWIAPQTGLWPDIMQLSRVSMGLAVVVLLALGCRVTWAGDEHAQRTGLKRVGKAALRVATTWTLLPFGLHLANELARVLVPGPELLLQSFASTASGAGVLAVVALVQPILMAVAVLAMAILHALIIAGFVLWPLAWPLRTIEHDLVEQLGRSITALFSVAVATKVLQAFGTFVLLFLSGAIESLLLRVLVFVSGTVGVFVVFPLKMLQHAERVMLLPGALAPSQRQVGRYVEESAKRVGQVHDRIETGRERVSAWHAERTDHKPSSVTSPTMSTGGVAGFNTNGCRAIPQSNGRDRARVDPWLMETGRTARHPKILKPCESAKGVRRRVNMAGGTTSNSRQMHRSRTTNSALTFRERTQ